jgi:hypothetical protein
MMQARIQVGLSERMDYRLMVGVAQLVEPRIVIPVVVGSSPIVHPNLVCSEQLSIFLFEDIIFVDGPLAQLVEQWTLNP